MIPTIFSLHIQHTNTISALPLSLPIQLILTRLLTCLVELTQEYTATIQSADPSTQDTINRLLVSIGTILVNNRIHNNDSQVMPEVRDVCTTLGLSALVGQVKQAAGTLTEGGPGTKKADILLVLDDISKLL